MKEPEHGTPEYWARIRPDAPAAKGSLGENTVLKPQVTLRIPEIGLEHVIDGEIAIG